MKNIARYFIGTWIAIAAMLVREKTAEYNRVTESPRESIVIIPRDGRVDGVRIENVNVRIYGKFYNSLFISDDGAQAIGHEDASITGSKFIARSIR